MSAEILEHGVSEKENKMEALPYKEYREVCDDEQPTIYRKTGVSSTENYQKVIEDDNTVYIELWGRKVPLFVRLENAGGYNSERTKKLVGVENAYSLALPLEIVMDLGIDLDLYLRELDESAAVIVETEGRETDKMKKTVANALNGGGWEVRDFLDVRCPENEQVAMISLYDSQFQAFDETGNPIPFRGISWEEAFEEERSQANDNKTVFVEAEKIRNDDEFFDELWQLHDEKFDWLGVYHPVSMQEGEDFFGKIVTNDKTKSIVRFAENDNEELTPVCQGIFMDGLQQIDWIKEGVVDEGENILFFYGVASKSSAGKMMHYANDVISLASRLLQRRGGKVRVLFESTTMSSQYIPRLVEEYTRNEPRGVTMIKDIEVASRVDYWCLARSMETV